MTDWRESLVSPFEPGISRKTVVSDPDDLFRDDRIFRDLTARGFTLVYFEDSISFRFTYESEFREAWDRGESRELVVIVRPDASEGQVWPADLTHNARSLSFCLKDIFPNLSYTVISKLDRSYYDALQGAQAPYACQSLGEALTKEFVLKHVFETVPELIKTHSDLLHSLLKRHYRRQQVPAMLDEHFLSVLEKTGRFTAWPLRSILSDRGAFWDFLQERWPLFVAAHAREGGTAIQETTSLKYAGAMALPFDHQDIRVYVDNLFTEGILRPTEWVAAAVKTLPWLKVGMRDGAVAQEETRFEDLCSSVEAGLPTAEASPSAWLSFGSQYGQMQRRWSEDITALRGRVGPRYTAIRQSANARFSDWLATTYRGIYNYPAVTPVMVHHTPGYLAHSLSQRGAQKVALIVMDGMAIEQWAILRDSLAPALKSATMQESALMAWIPTITPVSRQAAFSGRIPAYFSESVYRTDRDEYGWRQFWSDRGFQLDQVAFWTATGDRRDLDGVEAVLSERTIALGATIFKVDKIMHGVQVGAAGMASQVQAWAEEGFLKSLLERLLSYGFHIFITADHGNVCSEGIGAPKEGVLSETRGERCRIYSEPILRASTQRSFPGTTVWDHQGLPKHMHALLAPPGKSFVPSGETVVCHGGNSIDEVIVPFIEIARRKAHYSDHA